MLFSTLYWISICLNCSIYRISICLYFFTTDFQPCLYSFTHVGKNSAISNIHPCNNNLHRLSGMFNSWTFCSSMVKLIKRLVLGLKGCFMIYKYYDVLNINIISVVQTVKISVWTCEAACDVFADIHCSGYKMLPLIPTLNSYSFFAWKSQNQAKYSLKQQ